MSGVSLCLPGRPTHLKGRRNRIAACGAIVHLVRYLTEERKDVNCLRCRRTARYKELGLAPDKKPKEIPHDE